MAIIVTVLSASDSTVAHADKAPNLMNAVAMAAAARNGMSMGSFGLREMELKKALQGLLRGRFEGMCFGEFSAGIGQPVCRR